MAARVAVLFDDRGNRLGSTTVSYAVLIIRYSGLLYIRTEKGVRLPGGGMGVVYEYCDPVVRAKLAPA